MDSDRRLKWQSYLLLPLFFLAATFKLWTLHRRYAFDLIHAHWVIPNGPIGLLVSLLARIPLFVSLHGSDVFFARRNPLFGLVARWILERTAGVTACSPQLYDGAVQLGAFPERTSLVLWGADPRAFGDRFDPGALRRRWGLAPEDRIILALGRLVGKKGFDVLVQAMPAVLQAHPDARCVIAGDGPEGPALRDLAARLGIERQVLFPGIVPWSQVSEALALGELFVVPSVHDQGNLDGLPTVLLEAMAARRPIVASDVAGIPLVVRDGETGLLVPERDPVALAGAICRLLAHPDLSHSLGSAARTRVEQELNWDQVARHMANMYRSASVR